jgi:hypothetical protein
MDNGDEADQAAGGTPEQVADAILDDHLVLAVDGAWGVLEVLGVLQQGAAANAGSTIRVPAMCCRS